VVYETPQKTKQFEVFKAAYFYINDFMYTVMVAVKCTEFQANSLSGCF